MTKDLDGDMDDDDDRQWILELIHYNRFQATRLQKTKCKQVSSADMSSPFASHTQVRPLPQSCKRKACSAPSPVSGKPLDRVALGLDHRLWELERSAECFERILADPKMQLRLPKSGCLPGTAMKHSIDLVEDDSTTVARGL